MKRQSMRFDLAIVGGGVLGVMVAWLAVRCRPNARIALLDSGRFGGGATGHSAFLDMPYGITPGIRALSMRSRALFQTIIQAVPGVAPRGLPMRVVATPGRRLAIEQCLTQAIDDSCEATSGLAPNGFLVPSTQAVLGVVAAMRFEEDRLVAMLLRDIERQGAVTQLEGTRVHALNPNAGSCELTLAGGDRLWVDQVALCTGPWLQATLKELLSFNLEARIKRVAAALLPEVPSRSAVVTYLFDDDAFLLPQRERRRWLFSFRAEQWDVDPSAPHELAESDCARIASLLETYFPGSDYRRPLGHRVFCDTYSATRDPFVELVAPGVVAAGAAGGSGVRLAPGMAERALQQLGWV